MVKSHSTTEHMNVHWRALKPGDYMLERTLLQFNGGCFTTFVSYHFSVAAGNSIYLGEFHLDNSVPIVRDNYARDYAYFSANAGGEKPAAFTPALPVETLRDNLDCHHHF